MHKNAVRDKKQNMYIDKQELEPEYAEIFKLVDKEVEVELKKMGLMDKKGNFQMGTCHVYWLIKKEILKKKYNINRQGPSELNPNICFD